MRIPVSAGSRSASVKAIVIALLTLALLIPLGMIRSIVVDRQNNAATAALDIRNAWGGDQVISGPVLKLPYESRNQAVYGLSYVDEKFVYLIANELVIDAGVETEIRYRGIHKVPVFSSAIDISGTFDFSVIDGLGIATQQIRWSEAELFLGVGDPMALSKTPVVHVNANDVDFAAGGHGIDGLASQLSAPLGKVLGASPMQEPLRFRISVAANGSGSLRFAPLAESAAVTMSANWGSPSFIGRQLPSIREVRDDGFEATWHATPIGRKLPQAWIATPDPKSFAAEDAFGARFIQTVGLYQLIERSIKYAVLTIGLTFVAYFLLEIVAGLKLHPLQYLLVGLANTLFFLLLLSLSEHVGFGAAYLLSAGASTSLIAGYSTAILARRMRAVLIVGLLAALYAFLYLTLKAESFALLAGSLGLWVALAGIMYLTRRIDWYAYNDAGQKQTVEN